MVRADLLRRLRLDSYSFTLEPELTARLAQAGARISEVPIRYSQRGYREGKKIRPVDGLKAIWAIGRYNLLDRRFTDDSDFLRIVRTLRASGGNRRLVEQFREHLGPRVLELGAGLGALSASLLDRAELRVAEYLPEHVAVLRRRFGGRENVTVEVADRSKAAGQAAECVDSVVCGDALRAMAMDTHLAERAYRVLVPGGRLVLLIRANSAPTPGEVAQRVADAGFNVVQLERISKSWRPSWCSLTHQWLLAARKPDAQRKHSDPPARRAA
jgi:phospholipid N-methyltransferase